MKPSEVLRAAAEKIATPEKWTRGALAWDSAGEPIDHLDGNAVCWCIMGAIASVTGTPAVALINDWQVENVRGWLRAAIQDSPFYIGDWNDSTDHAEVLAALTKAAELAESEGQ